MGAAIFENIINILLSIVSMIRKYHNHKLQTNPHGIARKSVTTITRHQENKISKATSSLFPIKMIAKLEWTLSYVQHNIEQLQTPTLEVTINNESTNKTSDFSANCVSCPCLTNDPIVACRIHYYLYSFV